MGKKTKLPKQWQATPDEVEVLKRAQIAQTACESFLNYAYDRQKEALEAKQKAWSAMYKRLGLPELSEVSCTVNFYTGIVTVGKRKKKGGEG